MDDRQRVNAGLGLIAIGAGLLLVSLFLAWFKPELTAWTTFELVDLLLALIALACLFAVFARAVPNAGAPALPASITAGLGAAALLLVLLALVNHPPAAVGQPLDTGIWLALAGALLIAVGAALDIARISFTLTFTPREREARAARDRGVGSPPGPAPPPPPDPASDPTRPFDHGDRPGSDPETRRLPPDDRR